MKKGLLLLILTGISFIGMAQQYPSEWNQYTSDGYLYNIQSDRNTLNRSEAIFTNQLLDLARTNLAQQIKMRVEDSARMLKESIDGRSRMAYTSETRFSTDLELQLVSTETRYEPATGQGYAIAISTSKRLVNFTAAKSRFCSIRRKTHRPWPATTSMRDSKIVRAPNWNRFFQSWTIRPRPFSGLGLLEPLKAKSRRC